MTMPKAKSLTKFIILARKKKLKKREENVQFERVLILRKIPLLKLKLKKILKLTLRKAKKVKTSSK